MRLLLRKIFPCILLILSFANLTTAKARLQLEALPPTEIQSLENTECACIMFPQQGPFTKDNIIFSTDSYQGPALIRINGKTHALARQKNSTGKKVIINRYHDKELNLKTRSREVPYEKFCQAYPDPPTEGSCFLTNWVIKTQGKILNADAITLCSCPTH